MKFFSLKFYYFLLFLYPLLAYNLYARSDIPENNPIKIVDNPKNFQPKIDEATLQQLLMKPGLVSKNDYDQFWQAVGVKNQRDKEAAISLIKRDFLVFSQFNLELLECAQRAWMMRQIVKCSRAEAILSAVASNFPSQDDGDSNAATQKKIARLRGSIDSVIRSAAARGVSLNQDSPYQIKSLAQIQKDKTLLNQVIGRIRIFLQMSFEEN